MGNDVDVRRAAGALTGFRRGHCRVEKDTVQMSTHIEVLEKLHTALVDSCRGYVKAVEQAEDTAMYEIAEAALSLHRRHAAELRRELGKAGRIVDVDGSIVGTVHVAAVTLRSAIAGLDRTALSAFIDGEQRNVKIYDETIATVGSVVGTRDAQPLLTVQRRELLALIAEMERRSMPAIAA
jgi:hypothetical protein